MSADPELVHRVRAIVSTMAPAAREVFILSAVAERRADEIAEFLGIGIAEVEQLLVEAIVHLARGLPEVGKGEEPP